MSTILKHVWRFFGKQPFFVFVAVTIIALGVGANTAMFAVVYSVLLKPLPYPGYKELVNVWDVQSTQIGPMSYAEFEALSARSRPLQSVAAYFIQNSVISSEGTAERTSVLRASITLLPLLGQKSFMGPGFSRDADIPGSNREMMISIGLWRRRYGGNPDIVGKTSVLGQQLYTIVGVLSADFQFAKNADVLIPLRLNSSVAPPDLHFLSVVGRLRPGIQVEDANAELRSSTGTPSKTSHGLHATGLQSQIVSETRTPALLLFAATLLILFIALANVGNLILVQSAGRRREIALRLALGASRSRIVLQFLTESYVIALAGGAAGAVIAWLVLLWARNSALVLLPRSDEIRLYDNVYLFTLGVSLIAGLAVGLGTILQTKIKDIHGVLRAVRQSGASLFVRRWLDSLVISEIALTVVLLLGSGLLIRSFVKLVHENKGFVADHIFSLEFYLASKNYTPEQTLAFYSQMRQQLTAMPGVEDVGIVNTLPLTGSIDGTIDVRESEKTPATNLSAAKILTDGEYFSMLKIPLIAGRLFNDRDSLAGQHVAIIDETLAHKICGENSCLGKQVDFSWGKQEWAEIVGVVGAVRQDGLETLPKPTIYVPYAQKLDLLDTIALRMVVSSPLRRDVAETEFRKALMSVDNTQPPPKIKTISDILDASFVTREVILSLLGVFTALALFLSILGVYSVIAYSVTTRTAEFGVRIAMGAQPGHIVGLVLGHGLRLAGIGIIIGLLCSIFGIRFLTSMLYGIKPFDAVTFLAIVPVIVAVAVGACWIPSRRALAVEPSISLKSE